VPNVKEKKTSNKWLYCVVLQLYWVYLHCIGKVEYVRHYNTPHRGWNPILRPGEEWWGSQHASEDTDGQLLPVRI
jgi:hypothetical protein